MLTFSKDKKVVDVLRRDIEKAETGTLFFNNSFPEYDDEYVGKILSDFVRQGLLLRLSRGIYLKQRKPNSVLFIQLPRILPVLSQKEIMQRFSLLVAPR